MLIGAILKTPAQQSQREPLRPCWDIDCAVTQRGATHWTHRQQPLRVRCNSYTRFPAHLYIFNSHRDLWMYIYTHTYYTSTFKYNILPELWFLNIWRMWYLGNRLPRVVQINYRVNQHIASAWEQRAVGGAGRPQPRPGWEHIGRTAPSASGTPAPPYGRTPQGMEQAATVNDLISVVSDGFFSWKLI